MPPVYEELRRLARSYLGRERGDHTLQATALVHEAAYGCPIRPGLPGKIARTFMESPRDDACGFFSPASEMNIPA